MKMCKYSLKTRKRIKKLFDQGFKQIDIAKMVGCSRFTVYYSLKMLQEPELFNEKFLKGKKFTAFSPENSLRLNNNAKTIKDLTYTIIEEKKAKFNYNVKDKLWNGNIKIKLGETIYSGPPSKYKEGAYCNSEHNCSHPPCTPSRGFVNGNSTCPDVNKNGICQCANCSDVSSCANHNVNGSSIDSLLLEQSILSKTPQKGLEDAISSDCSSPLSNVPDEIGVQPTLLEDCRKSYINSVDNNYSLLGETRKNKDVLVSTKSNSILKANLQQSKKLPPRVVSAQSKHDFKTNMVRITQEPAKYDHYNTRKHIRAPKRFCTVDDLELDKMQKQSCPYNRESKIGRFRRLSCRSDFSDSENSDAFTSNADQDASKCRKRVTESNYSGKHMNGDGCQPLNGLDKTSKGRKMNKPNIEELDVHESTKVNGIESDFDRVDINLLLEISATDRKKFENKKAKIKRKTADWNLISETEQYYNEREEILRNKSKLESDGEISNRIHKSLRLQEKSGEYNVSREKMAQNGPEARLKVVKNSERTLKRMPVSTCTKELRNRSLGDRAKKPLYDLSVLEDDLSDLFDSEANVKLGGSRKKRNSSMILEQLPKRRLTNAERFLRDNKEYYQFPETPDRLRRSFQSPIKDIDGSDKATQGDSEDVSIKSVRNKAGRISSESTKSTEKIDDGGSPKSRSNSIESDLDNLYFSFEGEPRAESWYQTYQRLIDGVPDNEYKYEDHLYFVLPYEMPKEYFKDLYSKKFFSRRKNDLTDFVRKSPRCHASTLALFSDIFPTKRKKGKPGPKKVEEVSSDGASTPSRASSKTTADDKESTNNVLAISLYINEVMKSSYDPKTDIHNIGRDSTKAQNECRKANNKRRSKSKKCTSTADCSKEVTHFHSKEFNNKLTSEVDNKFLSELSDYLNEADIYPDDILSQDPSVALANSYSCTCTDDKLSDDASVCDITDVSSECISLCSVETLDNSFSNSNGLRNKLLKASYKKRRKNLTGWPKQRRRRPVTVSPSNDNDGRSSKIRRVRPKNQLLWRNGGRSLMESRLITEGSKFMSSSIRGHARRKSSIFYNNVWPTRHRSCK